MVYICIDDWIGLSSDDMYSMTEFEFSLFVYDQELLPSVPDLDDVSLGMYCLDNFKNLKKGIAQLLNVDIANIHLVWRGYTLRDHEKPYRGIKSVKTIF